MSVATEITRIKSNIESSFTKVAARGGIIPGVKNSENLPAAIDSIPSGGAAIQVTSTHANGTPGTVSTTQITIQLSASANPITTADISVTGATLSSFGTAGGQTQLNIGISNITVAQGQNVTITFLRMAAYAIIPAIVNVPVNVAVTATWKPVWTGSQEFNNGQTLPNVVAGRPTRFTGHISGYTDFFVCEIDLYDSVYFDNYAWQLHINPNENLPQHIYFTYNAGNCADVELHFTFYVGLHNGQVSVYVEQFHDEQGYGAHVMDDNTQVYLTKIEQYY